MSASEPSENPDLALTRALRAPRRRRPAMTCATIFPACAHAETYSAALTEHRPVFRLQKAAQATQRHSRR